MNLRSKAILEAAVKEYIRSGEPVSSKALAEKYDFGIKWAAIRRELGVLTQEGFLDQLHTSGGRVPTDKGYQFFVANTLDHAATSQKILKDRYGLLVDNLYGGRLKNFIDAFSQETKLLGIGQKEKDQEVYKSGLHDLISQLDLEDRKEIQEVVKDFDMLDKRLKRFAEKLFQSAAEPRVFIGKKSPITKSKSLSVIMDSFKVGDYKILIAAVGPKRMDYNKNLNLFKALHKN
jgi:transcriptional regulator of heat shock response